MLKNLLLVITLFFFISFVNSQSKFDFDKLNTYEGLFTFHHSDSADKIYLEVEHLDSEFLYVSWLSEGVGSNDLGLDRGQIGGTRVVKFTKAGNKLLLVQPNLKFRAITNNSLERKSVEEAFAKSVLFGFPIVEKTKKGYLIDLSPFLIQDTHGVAGVLKQAKQGIYRVDNSRSALNMERTKNFPENVDFDVLLTLTGEPTGREIYSVSPDAKLISIYQHHSFVRLPDDNFKSREHHPNCGSSAFSFMDYSSEIGESMYVNLIDRHRLEKKYPNESRSEAIDPIIYYLDNGTPEPIRSALLEGASWWNQAFEEIGFKDAFQVKMLPDTIDPLDVRYNVIQWVHRSTRGWSYGATVTDPRTGEIIKGHVSLGSLRVRQDFLIAQALSENPFKDGNDDSDKMLEFALARIRQLAAHEVGHTLGFNHNFAASTNNRSSVMDYPYPLVTIGEGKIDLSDAYAIGIGEWDKVTVAYAYTQFDGDEKTELLKIIDDARNRGLRYVSDYDSRSQGSANVYGHLWDNGANATDGLIDVIGIREFAMGQFGIDNIKEGDSYAQLEDLFVLLYFYHRYQVEAAIKTIAGSDYSYGLKNEIGRPTKSVSAVEQRRALEIILRTTEVEFLAVPKDKLLLFPSRADRGRESFSTRTGFVFDPISAATTAYDQVLGILLNAERINRLIIQNTLDADQLSVEEVLDALINQSLLSSVEGDYYQSIQISLQEVLLRRLMQLAQSPDVFPQVKSITNAKISDYLEYLKELKNPGIYQREHIRSIEMYFLSPEKVPTISSPAIPDGSPIGANACSKG